MSTADRILEAASALVHAGEPLSLQAIAERAGVARTTLYRHFSDIGALTRALVETGRVEADRIRTLDPVERILDAVAALVAEKGLAATTVDDVARRAGVSPVTVYRRFGDRNGLLRAFVQHRTPRRMATTLAESDGDLASDLDRIARECLAFLVHQPRLFVTGFSADPTSQELFREIRAGTVSMRETTFQVIRRHVPHATPDHALAFLGMLLTLGWDADAASIPERAHLAVTLFLHGVSR